MVKDCKIYTLFLKEEDKDVPNYISTNTIRREKGKIKIHAEDVCFSFDVK